MRFKKPKPLLKRTASQRAIQGLTGPPGHCPSCGVLFLAQGIFGGHKARIELSEVTTDCPSCGHEANILDGAYEMANSAFALLAGPKFTRVAVRAISELIEKAARNEISLDELQKQASQVDTDLGTFIARTIQRKGGMALLLLLLVLLKTCQFDTKLDVNELIDQISGKRGVIYDPSKPAQNQQETKPGHERDVSSKRKGTPRR